MGRRRRKKLSFEGPLGFSLKRETIFSIMSISFLLASMMVMFSFLRQGEIPAKINLFLFDWLGLAAIFVPFILILVAAMFSKTRLPIKEPNILIGTVLFYLSFLGLFKLGKIGEMFWREVSFLITGFGAFLIFLGGSLIGIVVMFNTSLDQLIQLVISVVRLIKRYIFRPRAKEKEQRKEIIIKEQKSPSEVPALRGREETGSDGISFEDYAKRGEAGFLARQELKDKLLSNLPSDSTKIWAYPDFSLLDDLLGHEADRGDVRANAATIERILDSFGITARVAEINMGPAVTQYALEVALGTKLSKITALSNDLALALAAPTGQIRIEAPIPGRSFVGIEVPNRSLQIVSFKSALNSEPMKNVGSKLTVPLGLDVSGEPKVVDIGKMPHVLIAGQTGSGKSVLLSSWIATFLFKTTPEEARLILIDPKRVELTRYNGVPHLLTPVIVEAEKVVSALKWAIGEMDRRYKIFAEMGARNIDVYNELAGFQALPYIIIMIDELADIMLFAPTEVEDCVCRIAQMARATGIHLILATQRPSVDVLTGLIKANIPCRISFAVASMTDSRVILDTPGAEKLLGRGDMLYVPPDQAKPTRIQGVYISDNEVNRVIEFLKKQQEVQYETEVISQPVAVSGKTVMVNGQQRDAMFNQAAEVVIKNQRASASLLQRKLRVGYARAARLLDELQEAGIVGPAEGAKPRDVLVSSYADEHTDKQE